jgi:putative hydrolase of the HAD superfamily
LRIDDLFEDVFAIENAGYCPKPQLTGFIRLLRKHNLNPARCVMVEDSAENLHAAKRLGMRTVWVNSDLRCPAFVDIKIHRVTDLPRALSRLG